MKSIGQLCQEAWAECRDEFGYPDTRAPEWFVAGWDARGRMRIVDGRRILANSSAYPTSR